MFLVDSKREYLVIVFWEFVFDFMMLLVGMMEENDVLLKSEYCSVEGYWLILYGRLKVVTYSFLRVG